MAVEHMRNWQIGDVTVTRLVELWKFTDHINMTIADAEPEEVIAMEWLHPHYATPDGQQIMNFQGFVVQTPTMNVMLDTCIGNGRDRAYDVFRNLDTSFIEDIGSLGLKPGDIDVVLCTHLHFDHVGWNTYWDGKEWAPTFPNARYLFGQTEYDAWEEMRRHEDHGLHDVRHLADSVDPIVRRGLAHFIDANHRISDELWTEPSHGHSPGHIHLCIESRGERGVITGDLMHHPIQTALPSRPARFDMDTAQGIATRTGFVEKYRDSGVLVIGAHFADPTAGWIRSEGDGTRFFGIGLEGS
ncbi:putative hydrolase [Sphingobium sp. SYK-6]|uniref:MBL fold metallo-hydrolase n=1 Tax=Sphingobium sp. (strain NBRC 103272 / SYK-6) TaxID=627192 RepID=UPI00022775E9|nr:MBL fold metallo-hydrolase [Sphingobium sp. SYK-6]BAK66691.1 putative hydrolase [Sphingobium sp. SYK-6]